MEFLKILLLRNLGFILSLDTEALVLMFLNQVTWLLADEAEALLLGNGTGQPRGVGKITRTLTRENRVLDLTG